MNVVLVGLDHHTAPLALRERVAVAGCSGPFETFLTAPEGSELLVIATCNRFEAYTTARETDVPACVDRLVNALVMRTGVLHAELRPHLYIASGEAAARHLCEVAAGKRSMIVGETQVVAQLRRALAEARRARTLGPLLHRLGNCALAASRRTRGRPPRRAAPVESICSRAVDVAHAALAAGDGTVAVIGAGQTAADLLQLLAARGVAARRIAICNRTPHRATLLAQKHHVTHVPWEGLLPLIDESTVVFFCTSSHRPVLLHSDVSALQHLPGDRRMLLDLGVPRNVDPLVATDDRVSLVDLDMLAPANAVTQQSVGEDNTEIDHWVKEFETWRRRRTIVPTLSRLQSNAEEIRERELLRLRQRLQLDDREFAVISAMSRRLVKQMLHRPLSTLAAHPESEELTRSARKLFDLER